MTVLCSSMNPRTWANSRLTASIRFWASSFSRLIRSTRDCSTSLFWAEKISPTRFSMSSRMPSLSRVGSALALVVFSLRLDGRRGALAFSVEMVDQDQDSGRDAVLEFDPHLVEAVLDHPVPADVAPGFDDLLGFRQIQGHAERGADLEEVVGDDP